VLLDPDSSAAFWQAVVAGTLDPEANG
jgi:hypothetical protein